MYLIILLYFHLGQCRTHVALSEAIHLLLFCEVLISNPSKSAYKFFRIEIIIFLLFKTKFVYL